MLVKTALIIGFAFLFAYGLAGTPTLLVCKIIRAPMAIADIQRENPNETTHPTKRVFMRAEHEDSICITDLRDTYTSEFVPELFTVVKREMTYYGPKLHLKANPESKQYLLTAPGPKSEAILWNQSESEWEIIAHVSVDFADSYPQYDICLHCNEPLSTVEHRRRSVIGACSDS